MKRFVYLSLLSTFSVLSMTASASNLKMQASIDLDTCQNAQGTTKTKIKDRIKISTELLDSEKSLTEVNKTGILSTFGYDGDPVTTSCSYFSNLGEQEFVTFIQLNDKEIIQKNTEVNLSVLLDAVTVPNDTKDCNLIPEFDRKKTTLPLIPTPAGQIVVKSSKYTALVNFHSSMDVVYDNKSINVEKVKLAKPITFSILDKTGTKMKFQDCKADVLIYNL
jgi:hypothetical protein